MEDLNPYQWKSLAKNSSLEEGLEYVKKSCRLVKELMNDCEFKNEKDCAIVHAFYELGADEKRKEHLGILKEKGILSFTTLMCNNFLKYNELLYEQVLAGERKARHYLRTGKISQEDEKNLRPFLAGNSRKGLI